MQHRKALLLSVTVAVLASAAYVRVLASQRGGELTEVCAASTDLAAGTRLTASQCKWIALPKSYVMSHDAALIPKDRPYAWKDRQLAYPVRSGDVVRHYHFYRNGEVTPDVADAFVLLEVDPSTTPSELVEGMGVELVPMSNEVSGGGGSAGTDGAAGATASWLYVYITQLEWRARPYQTGVPPSHIGTVLPIATARALPSKMVYRVMIRCQPGQCKSIQR